MADAPHILVIGSVNLDIVAVADRLPVAGETVTGASLHRFPGGKGANQALAARRLGAAVSLIACVGEDANADEALALLVAEGVDLSCCRRLPGQSTGVALIAVSASGENQIVVAPGANRAITAEGVTLPRADALVCQLEVPAAVLVGFSDGFDGLVVANLAPAADVPDALLARADVIVVNETEAAYYGDRLDREGTLVAGTFGSDGAELRRDGHVIARARPPAIEAKDTTGAGDAFTAALACALVEGMPEQAALEFACAAGAAAAMRPGAQPSLPARSDVTSLLGGRSEAEGVG